MIVLLEMNFQKCNMLVQNFIGNDGYSILVIGGMSGNGKNTKLSPVITSKVSKMIICKFNILEFKRGDEQGS